MDNIYDNDDKLLSQHAEEWWIDRGKPMPIDKNSIEYQEMYEEWVEWAFKDM